MAFVRSIVIEFIQDHVHATGKARIFEKLRKEADVEDVDYTDPLRKQILHSLSRIASDLKDFIEEKYDPGRFAKLYEPLIPILKNGTREKFYDAFDTVACGLFYSEFTWDQIVTFLVYNAELTNRVFELSLNKDKTYKMVSNIIYSVCRWCEYHIAEWVDGQEGGWLSLFEYEKGVDPRARQDKAQNSTDSKGLIDYVGKVVAVATIIGGLYIYMRAQTY